MKEVQKKNKRSAPRMSWCSEDIEPNTDGLKGKRGLLVKRVNVFSSKIDSMFFSVRTLSWQKTVYITSASQVNQFVYYFTIHENESSLMVFQLFLTLCMIFLSKLMTVVSLFRCAAARLG